MSARDELRVELAEAVRLRHPTAYATIPAPRPTLPTSKRGKKKEEAPEPPPRYPANAYNDRLRAYRLERCEACGQTWLDHGVGSSDEHGLCPMLLQGLAPETFRDERWRGVLTNGQMVKGMIDRRFEPPAPLPVVPLDDETMAGIDRMENA